MNNGLKLILYAILLISAIASPVFAERQWAKWSPEDGFFIRQGYHVEWYRGGESRDAGQLAGEIAIVWSDTRSGDRGVYTQVVGTEQGLRLKYPDNGLRISDAPNRQEDPGVWPAADGGWIFAWEDFDSDSLGDIYCTKINAQGERIWGGNEIGLAVCTVPGSTQEDVRIVEDGRGGAIIAWRDMRGGDIGNIYAHHILPDGRLDPNWPRDGLPVVVAVGPQVSHTADTDGEGGMIIGWKDGRIVGNFDIWAQRITPNGELLWGEGRGIIVCGTQANQESPKLCPDGAGGAFFTWVDDRNQPQSDKDIYAQRVDANGRLLWPAEGEAVCIEQEEQTEVRIIASEAGNAIIMWEDKRGDRLTYDVFAMRISGDQRMRKEWNPPTGVPVVVLARNQQQARLYPDGQGGAYFAWEDERTRPFPEVDIWAQRISRAGQPLWELNGIPVCEAVNQQHSPLVRRTTDGGCFIVWGDYRSGSQEIWGQKLSQNGQIVGPQNGIPIVQGIGGNGIDPRPIQRRDGSFSVFWLDGRFGGAGQFPFVQTVNDMGDHPQLVLPDNGAPALVGTNGGGINPDACEDGQSGTIVVWEDRRSGEVYAIYAQRLNQAGQRLWGEQGIKVADFSFEQAWPRICPDGAGGAYVAWKAPTDNDYYDVYMQRLSPNGDRLWGNSGKQITEHLMDEEVENIIPDGEGGVILVWKAYNDIDDTEDDLWITRLNRDGEMLWDDGDGGLVLCAEPNKQRSSKIYQHQNGFFAVWVDGRDDEDGQPQYDIFGQFIERDGTYRWRNNGIMICGDGRHQENPVAAIDNYGHIWVAWEDHRFAGIGRQRDIYLQKINPAFTQNGSNYRMMFENDGFPICSASLDQLNPSICHDGQNGVWLTWEDYRSGLWSDVYATHLNNGGEPYEMWSPNGNLICGAFHKQNTPKVLTLVPRGHSGVIVVWEDKRATGKEELSNVFIQKVDDGALFVNNIEAPIIPTDISLDEVYPNPFNNRARVTFSTLINDHISIALYDATGRRVGDIGSGYWTPGKYTLDFDASSLSSGTYYVRLETESIKLERSVKLLK